MSIGLVILIIVVGLLFLFAEFFLVPGLSIAGIMGVVIMGVGIYLAYSQFGYTTGNLVFLSTLVLAIFTFVRGLRRLSSNNIAVSTSIESRVKLVDEEFFKVGDQGKTISALRPGGKAIINEKRIEVFSVGDFIPTNTEVIISKIIQNKIYVKPVNIPSDEQ